MRTPANAKLQLAYDFIQSTGQHVFLTGKAGTGKTTFLKNLKKNSPKRMIVVAPTGVAAINAGGVTIHSFFQLPFGPQVPEDASLDGFPENTNPRQRINRFSKNKVKLIRSLDLVVIDEISMVRADVLDAIDAVLRRFRSRHKPFGGVQLLMIGDLQQLAPVVKEEDRNILKKYYDTFFFFSSRALRKSTLISIELQHIYRQSNPDFINLLNKVRDNRLDSADLELLNQSCKPGFMPPEDEGYITLTTHNYQAKRINQAYLKKLSAKIHRFECTVEGEFPQYAYPADEMLEVKNGAQVMFLKNDASPEKKYYNGKIGKVVEIREDRIEVLCPGESEPVVLERDKWENTRYRLNEETSGIEEEVAGTFTQFPLKLAWGITIHKSQGLTFEKVIIDARQSFAHGQVYVALSRCTNLEGLVLNTPLEQTSVINDGTVIHFTSEVERNPPGEKELEHFQKAYEREIILELFDYQAVIDSIQFIQRVWSGNADTLMGNLPEILQQMEASVQKEMTGVSEKFSIQVEQLLRTGGPVNANTQLQQRIKKALDYFGAKSEALILQPLERAGFQTDNKALRQRIDSALERLETGLAIIKACQEAASGGFTIKKHLEARARASAGKTSAKPRSRGMVRNVKNPEFFRNLMEWRDLKAEETGLTPTQILPQKVVVAIAAQLPPTAARLKAVKGMGNKKMEHFGEDILSLILNYRNERGMDIPVNAREEIAFAGMTTREVTLALFRQGNSPEKIASRRKMAVSTIHNHLTAAVGKGKLDVFELINRKKYQTIARELQRKGNKKTAGAIKNRLGDSCSYHEIRLVMTDMNK